MSLPDRLALFIDAAYFDKLVQGVFARPGGLPLQLDMRKLPQYLADGIKPWRILYYHAMPFQSDPPLPAEYALYQRKAQFRDFLARQGRWVVREGVVERRGGFKSGDWIYEQKRTDVMLAVDMARLAWRGEIDKAVLVAGDSDFIPAVADARAAGVHVTLRFGPETAHTDLIAACNASRILTGPGLETVARGAQER